jgi:hypothetical protein
MARYRIMQIEDYEPLIGSENVERVREKARRFKDLRVAAALLAFRPPDHATGNARSRVACRLRFEIVRFGVNHNGTANNRSLVICQRHVVIEVVQFCHTRSVRLDVAHVANMSGGRIGGRVWLFRWIKMGASRTCIGRRAIAKFMDMKPVFARSKASNLRVDLNPVGDFSERDGAANVVALCGVEHSNGFQRHRRFLFRRLRLRGDRRERQEDQCN